VWSGELYLEFHRGTYTSQARTKRGNRKSESLLREAELWAATAAIRTGSQYPYDKLEEAWHTVLLQQFHDILPGSSIAWVYRVAEENYARVEAELEQLISASIAALGESVDAAPVDAGDASDAGGHVLFNASPFEISGIAPLSAGAASRAGSVRLERLENGYALISDRARFVLDASGRIASAIDLATGRDAVSPGAYAAELQLFRDTPNQWEAWDIDKHYRRHERVLDCVDAIAVVTDDDERVAVRVDRSFDSSTISQEFALSAGSAGLEITTRVDWHERQKLLKLAFPVDVHAEKAVSEIQFGHISRPITENTSWDFARFETSAHRWMHVGEPGFGVAIANDATYGHDVTRRPRPGGGSTTLVRQSLVRAPLFPDPDADQGEHVFRSSFVVGAEIADAVREGYRINLPLRAGDTTAPGGVRALVRVDNPAVVIEAVKLAEDRSGDLIVRLYESRGARAQASVTVDGAIAGTGAQSRPGIVETDLLEREIAEPSALAAVNGGAATLSLRPFQLVTLRIRRG
jgi:alpha-mannosidase